jgi:hypothetical protein
MSEVIQFPVPRSNVAFHSAGRPEREKSANPIDTPIARAIDDLFAKQRARWENGNG